METHFEIRELSVLDGQEYLEMLREIGPGENGFVNPAWDLTEASFPGWLHRKTQAKEGVGLQPGWVPDTTLWFLVNGRPAGMAKLRHYLTPALRREGGHIGYCIRPSERGKGYGREMLRLLLPEARAMGIPRVMITVHENNGASRRMAESAGGVLSRTDNGRCFYWIQTGTEEGLREMHPDDYAEAYALWESTPGMGLTPADSEEAIRSFLQRNTGFSVVRMHHGELAGTCLCGHDGRRGFLYHVAVSQSCRGRGFGKDMVAACLGKLAAAGIGKCHLMVWKDNATGADFWTRQGWTRRDDLLLFSKNSEQ